MINCDYQYCREQNFYYFCLKNCLAVWILKSLYFQNEAGDLNFVVRDDYWHQIKRNCREKNTLKETCEILVYKNGISILAVYSKLFVVEQ